jgi:hypothetical protein
MLAGLDPATHVFILAFVAQDVDARVKPGQGDQGWMSASLRNQSLNALTLGRSSAAGAAAM